MSLFCLKANNFRNFTSLNLEFGNRFNFIYGPNGSGKTSILEAIHFLGLGRSFRTHLTNRITLYNSTSFSVYGEVRGENNATFSIGLEKANTGKTRIKMGNEIAESVAQLSRVLPLQLINPDSFGLLADGPAVRRKFLDWGVFHVEPSFFSTWQRFQRVLKQRNTALQQVLPPIQVRAWDNEIIITAQELAQMRERYVQKLIPAILKMLTELTILDDLVITYYQGWNETRGFQEVLEANYQQDSILKYTQFGPHRADLLLKIRNKPIQDVLSRGEQKLLVSAMRLAQGILLQELTNKRCIYLLDDIAAELDSESKKRIAHVLVALEAQVFVTAIEIDLISDLLQCPNTVMFHVEQGQIDKF